jgi:hypothetical protein
MLPGGIRQDEVVEPVIKRLTSDAHARIAHVSKVRKRLLAGNMVLTEDYLPLSPMLGGPGTDPALQAAAQAIPIMIRIPALHLLEQRHGPQAGRGLKHRADLAIPKPKERIGGSTSRSGFIGMRRRQVVRGLDAAAGPFAEPRLGGSDRLRMVTTEIHEQSHLLAGDVWSGHFGPRLRRGNHLARSRRGPQTRAKTSSPVRLTYGRATPDLRST